MGKNLSYFPSAGPVFLATHVVPVSPWTLSTPDQLVRHLCHNVWLVLCERTVSCGKTCVLERKFIARMFFKYAFLKVKKARPTHIRRSNSFAKRRGGADKLKKGGSDTPLLATSFFKSPL
jgi:hypothetical protein